MLLLTIPRRRVRRPAQKAHAHEPLQRAPPWLDLAHQKLDAAVAAAYGWVRAARAHEPEQPETDLTDEQILERLLALNLERAAEEEKAVKVKKPKTSRDKHADEML